MSTSTPLRARSIYRRLLRELPLRHPSLLSNPSPLQKHLRADFTNTSTSPHQESEKSAERKLDEAEEFVRFLAAQRTYAMLLERYNPGMNMSEEERVRLTARRVGMDLPEDMWRGR